MPGLLDILSQVGQGLGSQEFLNDPRLAAAGGLLSPTPGGSFGGGLLQGIQAQQAAQQNLQQQAMGKQRLQQAEQAAQDRKSRDELFNQFQTKATSLLSPGGEQIVPEELNQFAALMAANPQLSQQGISLLNATKTDAASRPTQVINRVVNGQVHGVLVDKTTGDDIRDLGVSQLPVSVKEKEKDVFGQEDKLRDEHTNLSGEFIKVRDSFGRIQESVTDPSAAGDLSLIFNYMKMLDPGSVVRESEFAVAEGSRGAPDIIRSWHLKVLKGERMPPNQRADFVNRANKLYGQQLRSQRDLDKKYTGLANRNELNPQNIVIDFNTVNRFRSMTPAELNNIDPSTLPAEEQQQLAEALGV